MFFLIAIIFLIQLILLFVLVSFLLDVNVKILLLTDVFEGYNKWLESRKKSIISIFVDIKFLIQQFEKRVKKHQKKVFFAQVTSFFEWVILFLVKKRGKQFLLGYKLAKALLKELSMSKNMV